jgi:hypothetical protein
MRITVEGARPKFMFCRIMHHLENDYGRKGDIGVANREELRWLRIEGDDLSVGLRFKKLDHCFRSRNHQSENQDKLRRTGFFSDKEHHLFLGYRMTRGLVPTISHIALTCEDDRGVRWKHIIWTAKSGMNPAQPSLPFEAMPPPPDTAPAPKIRPKRKPERKRQRHSGGQSGQSGTAG